VVLLTPRLAPLADLWELAASHTGRLRDAEQLVLVPNLVCVAGALVLGFGSMTAVVLSNLGTYGVYARATGSLRGLRRSARPLDPDQPAHDPGASPVATEVTGSKGLARRRQARAERGVPRECKPSTGLRPAGVRRPCHGDARPAPADPRAATKPPTSSE